MGGEVEVGARPTLVVALERPRPPWRRIAQGLLLLGVAVAFFFWDTRRKGLGEAIEGWVPLVILMVASVIWSRVRARRFDGPTAIQVPCRLLFPEPGLRGERRADLLVRPAALRIVRGSLEVPKGEQWVIPWDEISRIRIEGRPDAADVEILAGDGELLARLRSTGPAEVVLARFAAVGISPAAPRAADT